MIWTIIFFVSGGILGVLLHLADLHTSDWLFWAFLFTISLSNFSIAKYTIKAVRKIALQAIAEYHQGIVDAINSAIEENRRTEEEANGLDKV